MTCRIYPDPDRCNPRPLWAEIDRLGMRNPRMLGWWEASPAVRVVPHADGGAANDDVRATLFVGDEANGPPTFAIAIANWAARPTKVTLAYDWSALAGLGLSRANGTPRLVAQHVSGFQPAGQWARCMGPAGRQAHHFCYSVFVLFCFQVTVQSYL